jgi:hypothetical protein
MAALEKDLVQTVPARPVLTRVQGLRIVRRFLDELESQSLEVVLIQSRHWEIAQQGGKIRAVQSQNPKWYRDFCELYPARRGVYTTLCDWCSRWHHKKSRCSKGKRRKPPIWRRKWLFDTAVKRRDTVRGLNELLDGRCESEYAKRLRDFIRENWLKYA